VNELLRVYFDPTEIGLDGYPKVWHKPSMSTDGTLLPSVKDYVRHETGNRCVRCGHPYSKGGGEWTPCWDHCTHKGPIRELPLVGGDTLVEAQWRILTVHHLNGVKHDLRWWNLAALCQRCHLSVQTRVVVDVPYHFPHSEWFQPYVAGFYAWKYLGEELTREQTMARLDELLALELRQTVLF
jgi:5-methylcytosine-specific restriction endonuclease McrA